MEKTMIALVKKAPEPGLPLTEVPVPEIQDDEVLIETKAVGICGSDVHIFNWDKGYEFMEDYMPIIPGHEYSGIVVKAGKDVTAVKVGDRVVGKYTVSCGTCYNCLNGRTYLCTEGMKKGTGIRRNGAFAKYSVQNQYSVVKLPDSISYELGALVEPMSVSSNAVARSGLSLGDTVLISGPGPIGLLLLLFAKARGAGTCIVTGTKNGRERLRIAREIGADYTFVDGESDIYEEVMKITDGHGVDIILEASNSAKQISLLLKMLCQTGKLVCTSIFKEDAEINMTGVVRNAQSVIGAYAGGPFTWEKIVAWLSSDNYYARQATKIISGRSRLRDSEEVFDKFRRKEAIKEIFIDFD